MRLSAQCDAAEGSAPGHYWAEGDLPLTAAEVRAVPERCPLCGRRVRFRSLPPVGFERLGPPLRIGPPEPG